MRMGTSQCFPVPIPAANYKQNLCKSVGKMRLVRLPACLCGVRAAFGGKADID